MRENSKAQWFTLIRSPRGDHLLPGEKEAGSHDLALLR